jgi:hypothetical protein
MLVGTKSQHLSSRHSTVSWYQETPPRPFPDPNRFLPYWIHTSGANKSIPRNLCPISHQSQLVLEILGSSRRRACLIYFFYSETIVGSCNLEDGVLELVDQSWGGVGGWILFVSFEIEGKNTSTLNGSRREIITGSPSPPHLVMVPTPGLGHENPFLQG